MYQKRLGRALFVFSALFSIVLYFILFAVPTFSLGTVSLNYSSIKINRGETFVISVNGGEETPVFTSSNVNIAKVSSDGKITAMAAGTTYINVRVGTSRLRCKVVIVNPTIRLNTTKTVIYYGGTAKNTVTLKCTAGGAYKGVTWSSDNESVATVDAKGVVTSTGVGNANITATANGISATCAVEVKKTDIALSASELSIGLRGVGNSAMVSAVITGSNKAVRWTTSNAAVARVAGGKITAKGVGEADITAYSNGVNASVHVVVRDGIAINAQSVTLYTDTGDFCLLKTNAVRGTVVTWQSMNESVATVLGGRITPVSQGETTVKAYANGSEASVKVIVKQTTLNIEETDVELKNKYDNVYSLNYTVTAKKPVIKWTTSNAKVATVKNGIITAKSVGNAVITAESNGIKKNVNVRVRYFNPSITLNCEEYTLFADVKDTVTLKAKIDGPSAVVDWSSDNTNVAWVINGKVYAVGAGTANIRARANGASATCRITVLPTEINMNTNYISLDRGETENLVVDVSGKNAGYTIRSTNAKIASVTSTGVVKGLRYGEAEIIVTSNGISKYCHVEVTTCDHVYGPENIIVESTCTQEGYKEATCTLCGHIRNENIAKKPHNEAAPVKENIVEPTCTTIGHYDQVVYCTVCNKEISREKIKTEKTAHTISSSYQTVRESTCYEKGLEARVCTACGLVMESRETNALSHEYEWKVTKEPSEWDNGYESYTCKHCGAETESRVICIHRYRSLVTEANGSMWVRCNDCGQRACDYRRFTDPATCKHEGETYIHYFEGYGNYTCCEQCSKVLYKYDLKENCNHKGYATGEKLIKHAGQTEDGTAERYCLNCGETIETITIHAYKGYTIDLGNGQSDVVYGYFDDKGYAEEIMDIANQQRANQRICSLTYASFLQADCDKRAIETAYSFSHVRPNGQDWYTLATYPVNGENLGKGYPTAYEAMQGWLASPGHRQNVLKDWYRTIVASCFHLYVFDEGSVIPREQLIWVQWFSAYDGVDLGLESEDQSRYEGIHITDENYEEYLYLDEKEDSENADEIVPDETKDEPADTLKNDETKSASEDSSKDKGITEDKNPASTEEITEDKAPASAEEMTEDKAPAGTEEITEDKAPTNTEEISGDKLATGTEKMPEDKTPTTDTESNNKVDNAPDAIGDKVVID